jgi:hypothetical protein
MTRSVIPAPAGIQGVVAVLGAPGTGKTRLARELAAWFSEHGLAGLSVREAQGGAAIATLLTGLDLPSAAQGEPEDARIRERLQSAGVAYQVVYGSGAQRLRSALLALDAAGVLPAGLVQRQEEGGAGWTWVCEKCSDPACEHRLFTRLRQER